MQFDYVAESPLDLVELCGFLWGDPLLQFEHPLQGKLRHLFLTTTPNSHLADIHDRMPVILPSGAYTSWLNPAMRDSRTALGWLLPCAGAMRRYAVSTRINHVQNDDEDCSKPVTLDAPPQGQLFELSRRAGEKRAVTHL